MQKKLLKSKLRMLGAVLVPTKRFWVNQDWNRILKGDLWTSQTFTDFLDMRRGSEKLYPQKWAICKTAKKFLLERFSKNYGVCFFKKNSYEFLELVMFVRHLAKCSLLWMGLPRVRVKAKFFWASFPGRWIHSQVILPSLLFPPPICT